MRALAIIMALGVLPGIAAAQVRQNPEQLRAQITQRFMENYRQQAGLTDEQFVKFQASVRRHWDERRDLQQREMQTMQALGAQLRPGIAADEAEVTHLLDEVVAVQQQRVDQFRTEQKDLATYLSPVQRAQFVVAFARLEQQIQQLMQRRMEQRRGQ